MAYDTPLGLLLYPTVPAQVTGASSGASRYSGGLHQSLGGSQGLAPVPTYFPFAQEIQFAKVAPQTQDAPCSWHRLFKDSTAAILTAGTTIYRGLMLLNDGQVDFDNMVMWLTQPRSGTAITIGLETPSNGTIQRVTSETSAPGGGVVFSSPTSSATLAGPVLFEDGDLLGIWVKQVISAGQAAYPFDYWGLHIQVDDYDIRTWYFFQHLLAGRTIASVTSTRATGVSTYVNRGETFTITMSGSPSDPAQSKVYVLINGPEHFGKEFELPGVDTVVDLADRSSAGVYTYQWRPTVPGFYNIEFNIGEDFYRLERNVLP